MTAPRLAGRFELDGRTLFSGIELDLTPGEWTCLLGPSGCGKTTILRTIAGLETAGRFTGDLRGAEGRAAYMAQSDMLVPWLDVVGNVVLGARLRGEAPDMDRAASLIARAGLAGHAHKRPGELSGGMRQRAALARTLMENRPVALLDEPFSALDAANRAACQEIAFEMLRGKTVLLVTHDPAEAARLGHCVHVMRGGRFALTVRPEGDPVRDPAAPATIAAATEAMAELRAA